MRKSEKSVVFTFGDPMPVMDQTTIFDYLHSSFNGRYYEPPIRLDGLAKSFRANPHHQSAIRVKVNVLLSCYRPHPLLSRHNFGRFALDYLVFGNAYLERRDDRRGRAMRLEPTLARHTRRISKDAYLFLDGGKEHRFAMNSIFHLIEPDINQEYYGLPEYLAALQSAWLNEAATLFRRKYYLNGSHAGFILYMTDAAHQEADIDALRDALKSAKGPGNFRNLFMYAPDGKKDGIQLIPIADVSARDEFLNIKNLTRDDILVAHRVPPQLMGIVPNNTGGFGSAEAAAMVFARNELEPLQVRFTEVNDWLGEKVIAFAPYTIDVKDPVKEAKAQ